MTNEEMVRAFHAKYDQTIGATPAIRDSKLRAALMTEELGEFLVALEKCDLVGAADAIVDLLFVTYGTAVSFGLSVQPLFEEVWRSNMTKTGGKNESGKILKGPDFVPPRIGALLIEQIRKRPNVAPSVPYFCHECLEGGPHPNVLHSDPDGQCLAWNPSDGRRCACAAGVAEPTKFEIVAACTPLTTVVIEEVIAENLGWDGDCGTIETFVPTAAPADAGLSAQVAELTGQLKIAREAYNHLIVKNLELEAVLDKLEGWRAP